MSQPFEITPFPGDEGGRTAFNGAARLTVLEAEARLFRRRAVKVSTAKPAAEAVLPMLNQLAGDLVANLEVDNDTLRARLADIAAQVKPQQSTQVEWAVAELNGVRVYFDGCDVVVTTRELQP